MNSQYFLKSRKLLLKNHIKSYLAYNQAYMQSYEVLEGKDLKSMIQPRKRWSRKANQNIIFNGNSREHIEECGWLYQI